MVSSVCVCCEDPGGSPHRRRAGCSVAPGQQSGSAPFLLGRSFVHGVDLLFQPTVCADPQGGQERSRNQSLQTLLELSHSSDIGINHLLPSALCSKHLSGFLVLSQLFICSLFNVYRWLFLFCINSLQSNISSSE